MLRRALALTVVAGAAVVCAPAAVAAQEQVTEVSELIADPGSFTGHDVLVRGELIGDYGFRGNGFMWTQLNDDPYALFPVAEGGALVGSNVGIGIRMPEELGMGLDPPGGYRRRGPVVLVSGIFVYHDPGRQGETYIDVSAIRVVEPGTAIDEDIDIGGLGGGVALLLGALAVHWWRRRRLSEV